jgi:tricorn protease
VVDATKPANVGDGRINLSQVKIAIDPKEEFMQIFNEAWRIQRDWFYDANMHGVNWNKVGEKYRKFVAYCDTRENLNYLIGEMIAELNAGHTYIYGGDSESYDRVPVGMLGVDFSALNDSPYPRIERIIPGENYSSSAYSPFYMPGSPIREGDYIIAIDGEELKKGDNIYKLLKNKRSETVEITYNSTPSGDGAKTYYVKTARSEYTLRYRDWVKKNREYVVENTGDEVAYVHLPGMMQNGLIELAKEYFPNYYKKGIIIDARYNGGGFTSKQIVDRLERKRNTMMQPREGMPTPIPERAFHGHLVLIINANTGSDGELFSEAWRYRDFGPIIGERTWGGAVGIEPHQNLIDGAACTPPQFGEYSIDGRWVIEGRGVEPDIEIVNMPRDVLEGKDAQLDKAIEVILDKIRNEPKIWAPLPQYPDKSKPTIR